MLKRDTIKCVHIIDADLIFTLEEQLRGFRWMMKFTN